MPTLTLPIVIGRQYVRRDGQVVPAMRPRGAFATVKHLAFVGVDSEAGSMDSLHVFLDTGRISSVANDGHDDPRDLVGDHVEPAASGHPFAHILHAIADRQAVQSYMAGEWCDRSEDELLKEIAQGMHASIDVRVKPRVVRIGAVEIPEPLREAPPHGATVYLVDLHHPAARPRKWSKVPQSVMWLERGQLHATQEAADLHFNALLAFTSPP